MIKITIEGCGKEPVVIEASDFFLVTKTKEGYGSMCKCNPELIAVAAVQAQAVYIDAMQKED